MGTPVWIDRWRRLLSVDEAARHRLHQGRVFQRSGRVATLRVEPGRLSGRVQGSRPTPYHVEVLMSRLDEPAWRTVASVVAGQVRFAAGLLAGQVTDGLVGALDEAGVDLFGPAGTIDARCPCGETVQPCAHVVALWEQAAARFTEDPFALFALRGRGRQQLLAELLALRRRHGVTPETVEAVRLPTGNWTRTLEQLEGIHLPREDGAADPLRLLGDPPGWAGPTPAEELFRPLVDAAARRARELSRG